MGSDVFVWIEQFEGQPVSASWEAMSVARRLADEKGGKVTACLFGGAWKWKRHGLADACPELSRRIAGQGLSFGADEVLVAEDATLADGRVEAHCALLADAVRKAKPDVVLIGATFRGRELGSALAMELNTGCIADCISLEFDGDQLVATRPIYAGKLMARCTIPERRPQVFTMRARAFERGEPDSERTGAGDKSTARSD